MTEEELEKAHAVLDTKRLTLINRTVVPWLYDAVIPNGFKTPATTKLRSILQTQEVTKIFIGEELATKSVWADDPLLALEAATPGSRC